MRSQKHWNIKVSLLWLNNVMSFSMVLPLLLYTGSEEDVEGDDHRDFGK